MGGLNDLVLELNIISSCFMRFSCKMTRGVRVRMRDARRDWIARHQRTEMGEVVERMNIVQRRRGETQLWNRSVGGDRPNRVPRRLDEERWKSIHSFSISLSLLAQNRRHRKRTFVGQELLHRIDQRLVGVHCSPLSIPLRLRLRLLRWFIF